MSDRLTPQDGEWIDRAAPVRFRFENESYEGFFGDTLSSALWAAGQRVLGRSFKYHRPRGVYSLAGHDVNVMVEDDERPNQRGDELAIRDGLDVRATNTAGGVRRDRLQVTQWFSRFMPVGFYYKAFYSPRRLFPIYERSMRKVAGLGHINRADRPRATPKRYDACDLLVVGAGPSGLSAAVAAAERGARVVVVDEMPRAGGTLGYQHGADAAARDTLLQLLDRAAALPNLEVRTATQAAGWYADHWIALVDAGRLTKMRARAILIAAGCYEQPAVFGGNDLPGVMLGSAAQRLIRRYAVRPCRSAVVLAANAEGYQVALDLCDVGIDVAVVADLRQDGEPGPLARRVGDAGIEVCRGHVVYEATASGAAVGAATVCRLDETGRPDLDRGRQISCDGIVMSVGWAPTVDLLYQAGGRLRYDDRLHQFVPDRMPEGVFAAGRVNGVFELEDKVADGLRAGRAAASYLGMGDADAAGADARRGQTARSHPYPIYDHAHAKNFVELDEDLHLADFHNAIAEGYDNIELLKRYTTVGMGPTQGKHSNMNAIRILARRTGRSIDETGSTTSRPFHHPVSLNHLAGRRFTPARHTPMHDWHARRGAVLMDVGAWKRPEYYGSESAGRDDLILAEAMNVRRNVGLIDLSTLGKIEVFGPDAVAMLERTYTGRFTKLQVGRCRYVLACDETGVVIDDGIVARRSDDRFYLTATTSGVEAFFRAMQRDSLMWGLDVGLVNATGRYAAMNIAGPKSREVLQPLTDIDLGAEAFPFVGFREGRVADAPALLMRVGFVGELGYEVHVPASYGRHVWQAMMDQGRDVGIAPFGVEAQRLLRLEKGHIIVSQDTDALTTPFEVDAAWAIGKNKPFFVGQRTFKAIADRPLSRRIVGIAFRPDHPVSQLPEECHLIIRDGRIAGRVTSIACQSTLGRALGLAFVEPDMVEPGTRVAIRIDGGAMVDAEVVATPFYDPENKRQEM